MCCHDGDMQEDAVKCAIPAAEAAGLPRQAESA